MWTILESVYDILGKSRSVMLNLVIVNVGNSTRTKISIVVLTLIAWVTIVTSVQRYPTTYNQDVA